jgi:predicted nuclease of predicted toxin-antitoxin system
VWGPAAATLRAAGHEVEWTGSWAEDPGDQAILEIAYREGQVVVTLDKDFGELAIVRRKPHRGIVRLVGIGARDQGSVTAIVLANYGEVLTRSGIVTVEPSRVRVREAE